MSLVLHISVYAFTNRNQQDIYFSAAHVSLSCTLQENLVYITCTRQVAISADLIYHITQGDSVFIISIYQLDGNTLLVDLNVPTGELEYNLTTTMIEVCDKYFWDLQRRYIYFGSLFSQ